MTFREGRAHSMQSAQLAARPVCSGQTTTGRPFGVVLRSGWSFGTTQTTGSPVSL